MRIRVTNPAIDAYQIDKIAGRHNIGMWLASKGILNWQYSFSSRVFMADVADDFDLALLSQWGTVEVVTDVY